MKALGSLKWLNLVFSLLLIKSWYLILYGSLAYKYTYSISIWLFIKFNNASVFSDLEPPIINVLYQ